MPYPELEHALYTFAGAIRYPNNHPLPDGVSRERLEVYHELFFNNFRASLESAYPVLHEVLPASLWERLIGGFFAEHRCTTPEFPRMPQEFLHWLRQRKQTAPDEPPWLIPLALWEWTELEVLLDESEPAAAIDPLGDLLQGQVVLTPTLRLHAFDYPVHHIAPDALPEAPLAEPIYLAAYRNREDETAFLELNAFSAALLARLSQWPEESGRRQLEALAEAAGWKESGSLLEFGAGFLDQMRRQGVVLGTTTTDTTESTS